MPPPVVAELPLMVLLWMISLALPAVSPSLLMPPPTPFPMLPLTVLLLMVREALPEKPSLRIPPLFWAAELPLMVLLLTVSTALPDRAPKFRMPPAALVAELPLTVQLLTVRVAWSLRMPPPLKFGKEPATDPLAMVSPESVTVFPLLMVKMRNAEAVGSRFTVSVLAPGPRILMLLLRLGNAPFAFSVIVPVTAK